MAEFREPDTYHTLFQDPVFSAKDWHFQKSWKRHLPDGTVFRVFQGFWQWIAWFTFLCTLVCAYHQWIVPALAAPPWPDGPMAGFAWQVFNLTAFALSLLMVFRTNSSYARWWEARCLFGNLIHSCRNLARGVIASFPKEDEAALAMFIRWTSALGYLVKDHLAGFLALNYDQSYLSQQLEGLVPAKEVAWVASWSHRPHGGVQILTDILYHVNMPLEARIAIDDQLRLYVTSVAACERIARTPIPDAYTRHTSRFMMTWLTFLPFVLWPTYRWAAPPIIAAIAFLLIGTENVGIQIEEPFSTLPMENYCQALAATVLEMYDRRAGSRDLVAKELANARQDGLSETGMTGGGVIKEGGGVTGGAPKEATAVPMPRGNLAMTSLNRLPSSNRPGTDPAWQ